MNRGVIYTAGGSRKYVDEALFSIKSLKKYNSSLGVTLFTDDKKVRAPYIDHIVINEPIQHPQKWKIQNMLSTPYDYTLYIDSDTKFQSPIIEMFDFLQIYDVGFTHRVKCTWGSNPEFIDFIDRDCVQGGFMLYKKNSKAMELIQRWHEKMQEIPDEKIKPGTEYGDQKALNDILLRDKFIDQLNHFFLPNTIYNSRPWMWRELKAIDRFKNIKILHNRGLHRMKKLNSLLYIIKKSFF